MAFICVVFGVVPHGPASVVGLEFSGVFLGWVEILFLTALEVAAYGHIRARISFFFFGHTTRLASQTIPHHDREAQSWKDRSSVC